MATGAVPLLPGLPGEGAAVTKAAIYTVKLTLPWWRLAWARFRERSSSLGRSGTDLSAT
jgi:hypothetical protein